MAQQLNTLPINCISATNVLILPSATRTTSGTGVNDGTGATAISGQLNGVDSYSMADIYLTVGTVTGTSPTLNVYLQKLSPDNTTWQDIASCTQITSSTQKQSFTPISSSQVPFAPTDASLTQTTMKLAAMGGIWRVKYVIGGTNPSFASFAVWGNFYA